MIPTIQILCGDALEQLRTLPDVSVNCCVTSPPYWGLRDYNVAGQIGLEKTPAEYVAALVAVFSEVRRVLRNDGTLWLNVGSSYASGDTGAIRSRRNGRVLPCGNDGKAPEDSLDAGRVCPDCGGALSACSLSHPRRMSRSAPLDEQCGQPPLPRDHDNAHLDCAEAFRSASVLGVLGSTTASSNGSAPADSCREDGASACPPIEGTSSGGDQSNVNRSACTSDIVQNAHPSACRMSDNPFVCMACGYSTRMFPPYKQKDLINIPFLVAEALRADGWYLRSEITWCKKAPMPESVKDRPTCATEKIFLLSKSPKYYFNADAVRTPPADGTARLKRAQGNGYTYTSGAFGQQPHSIAQPRPNRTDKQRGHSRRHAGFNERWDSMPKDEQQASGANMRNYWLLGPENFSEAHFAVFPSEIPRRAILAGCPVGGAVLDCFAGAGTTGMVATELGRKSILIELNTDYVPMIRQRCNVTPGLPI